MPARSNERKSVWTPRKERLIEALESRLLLTTLPVINTLDSGAGSPGQAIVSANSSPGAANSPDQIPGSGPVQTLGSMTVTTVTTYIRLDSTGANIQIYNASTPTGTPTTFPVGSVSSINVSPTTGNDLLVVDYSNGDPVPSGGISYTGGGAGGNTLQILGASAADTFWLNQGNVVHGSGTVTYSNTLTLTLGTGTFTAAADLNLLDVTVNAQTLLNATTTEHIGQLTVNLGGTSTLKAFFGNLIVNGSLQFAPDGTNAATSHLNNLLLAGSTDNWTGRLDLTNDKLIVATTAQNKAATLAMIRNEVAYGLSHPAGILSTALPAHTVLAVIDAATTTLTSFGGVAIDANSILIGPELPGDANIDGQVNQSDLVTVLNNFGSATPNWTSGNFDSSPTIDLTDFAYVLNNFGRSIPNPNTAAPSSQPGNASQEAAVPADPIPAPVASSSSSVPGAIVTSPVVTPGGTEANVHSTPPAGSGNLPPEGNIVPTGSAVPTIPPASTPVAAVPVSSPMAAPVAVFAPPAPISAALPPSSVSVRKVAPATTVHSASISAHLQPRPKAIAVTYTLRGRSHYHFLGTGDRKQGIDMAMPGV